MVTVISMTLIGSLETPSAIQYGTTEKIQTEIQSKKDVLPGQEQSSLTDW